MNSATSTTTGNASHDTISEDSTVGIDLLYSEADESKQANKGEQAERIDTTRATPYGQGLMLQKNFIKSVAWDELSNRRE